MPFQPGQSGNPTGKPIHGLYRVRRRVCEACGKDYVTQKLNSRYCGRRCQTSRGPWSYPANAGPGVRLAEEG